MHWPYQRSIKLNKDVAQLFIQTYNKFFINLINRTNYQIPIDILSPRVKKTLLLNTLIEIEIVILDVIELNLTISDIEQKYKQIMYDLICKIIFRLLGETNINNQNLTIDLNHKYNKIFFGDNGHLFKHLITYLTFGSQFIRQQRFGFEPLKTPKYHVKILLEHFIIKISNNVILNLLEKRFYQKNLFIWTDNDINYDFNSKSIRELSNFQNNLLGNNWVYYYIYYPQNMYCNQYKIWLFSSKGLIYKYIYGNRYSDYLTLSPSLMSSIIYLELQDFILPKINFLITLLGRLIIYISIDLINKGLQIFFSQILITFHNRKKL